MFGRTRTSRRGGMPQGSVRARSVVLLAIALLLGVMATAGPALAEPTLTLCFDSTGAGRNVRGWLPGQTAAQTYWAGVLNVRADGISRRAFCTDIHNGISQGSCYASSTFGVTGGWVAQTISDYPPALGLTDTEAAARQAAVWYFSDGLVLDPSYNASLYARTQQIIASIEAKCSSGGCDPLLPPVLSLDPASEVNWLAPDGAGGFEASEHLFTVSVMRGLEPVVGAEVTVSTTLGELSWEEEAGSSITVETDADGIAIVSLTHDAVGTAVITAKHMAAFPAGTIINPGSSVQKVVVGGSFDFELTASATKQWEEGERIVIQKFYDANGNGVQDDGEQLIDWTVSYREHGAGGAWTNVQLGADGTFVLGVEPDTSWDIRETSRTGWLATTPSLVEGVTAPAVVKFGNLELSTIVVEKFHDLDGDGLRGQDEPGLSGWGYALYRNTSAGWSSTGFASTGATGLAGFNDLASNTYRVVELVVSGWYTSTAHIVDVPIGSGAVYTATFGNLQPGSIVFSKTWLWDGEPTDAPDEPATLCVRRTGPGTPSQQLAPLDGEGDPLTADAEGWYCQPLIDEATFDRLWPGIYEVSEQSPTGWEADAVDDVTVLSGQTESRTMENNLLPGSLMVSKVVEWGNVTPDQGQAFTITVTGPSYPSGDSKTVGYNGGTASWTGLEPGTYTVSESDPGAAWALVGSGVEVEVAGGVDATATITNTYQPGSLTVSKVVEWGNVTPDQGQAFTITVTGPSYPSGDSKAVGYNGGTASWTGLEPGTYTVSESDPGAAWAVVGSGVEVEVARGAGATATITNTLRVGSIAGVKYNDLDGSGARNDGEPGVAGWVIELSGPTGSYTTTTGADGSYSFGDLPAGTYTLCEGKGPWPTGSYDQTEPTGGACHTVVLGDANFWQVTDVSFGNRLVPTFQCLTVFGHKWNDLNGDGVWDDGEPGIAGWAINLSDGETVITTTTNAEGYYSFDVCETGSYTVSEQMQPGWVASTPTSVTFEAESGEDVGPIDFGNYQPFECVTIHGYKWNDLDGNGVWDDGEPGIAGWVISLSDGATVVTTTTDAQGYYGFEVCEPGTYTVTEQMQPGWLPTTPTEVVVTIEEASVRVDFGNRTEPQQECGVVHGYKWNDLNGDGVWQRGEPALRGWQIVLERIAVAASEGELTDTAQWVAYTDANGYYRFEDICEPGLYQVYEVQQDGWLATTPMLVTLDEAWQGTTRVDFGNRTQLELPTPEPPCIRADVSVIIYGGWNDIAITAWVGGTEQETLYTKLNSFGEPQVMWTLYPPETGRWDVSVQPQLPAGLDPAEWELKLVRIESPTEGWVNESPSSGSVSIQRCDEYVIYYQLVHTGAQTPTPVPTPWELPQTGSAAESPTGLSRVGLYALVGLNLVSGAYLILRKKRRLGAK